MKLVPTSATRAFGKTTLQAKKNSPHIFFGLGLAGAVASVILACRATLKLEDRLEDVRDDVREANLKALTEVTEHFAHGETVTQEMFDRADLERAKEVSVVTFKGA